LALLGSIPAATPPTITGQPFDKSATVGEKCIFQVTATGTPPLSYQWRLNGVDIPGPQSQSAKYTTPPAVPENNGNVYSVVVSNSAGSVTSVNAVMTVPPSEAFATAADGSVLHWDVYTPEGTGPWPAFINIHGGGFVAGSPTSNQEGVTICKDLQAAGYITFAVTYRLAPPGKLPDQTSSGRAPEQYDDVKLACRTARADPRCNGLLGAIGGSAGAAHAAWLAGDNTTTTDPPWSGDDRPDVVIAMSGPYDYLDYRDDVDNLNAFIQEVTNYCGVPATQFPTPEDAAILKANSPVTPADETVKPLLLFNSTGDTQPYYEQDDMVAALDAALGDNPKNYEAYTIHTNDHGFKVWYDTIDETGETVKDRTLAFTAQAFAAVMPSIIVQPSDATVLVGHKATFAVTATGKGPLSYQWRKNSADISGATGSTYTTAKTSTSDNGTIISVKVSNSRGSVVSADAILTVTSATAPVITAQPADAKAKLGKSAAFSVVATGTPPLSYQWRKNGADIVGATKSSYTTPPASESDNGSLFSVVISNRAGSVTSRDATLSVK
jgi:acetyl esterase/lipase